RSVKEQLSDRGSYPASAIADRLVASAQALYEDEGFGVILPPPPGNATDLDAARYRDRLSRVIAKLVHPQALDVTREAVLESQVEFCKLLPPVACQAPEALGQL